MRAVVAPAPIMPVDGPARGRAPGGGADALASRIGRRRCNAAGLRIIRAFEGFVARPYVCPAGVWTIGYGATRDAGGRPVTRETPPLDPEQAAALLARDVGEAEGAVARLLPVPLTDDQYAALVSFTFNLGGGALQRSTLRQRILRGEHGAVPAELAKWVRGGGRVMAGLVRRRAAEAALFSSGSRRAG